MDDRGDERMSSDPNVTGSAGFGYSRFKVLGFRFFCIQGNVDPMVLFGSPSSITGAVRECLEAGGGQHHIVNVGHGVVQVSVLVSLEGQ